jgi:hypothetical protein
VIKATLAEISIAAPAVTSLLKERLPIKAKYHLGKLAAKLETELRTLNTERMALFREYGAERPATQEDVDAKIAPGIGAPVLTVPPEKMEEFSKKVEELLSVEAEIDLKPVPLSLFGDSTVEDSLRALDKFLVE